MKKFWHLTQDECQRNAGLLGLLLALQIGLQVIGWVQRYLRFRSSPDQFALGLDQLFDTSIVYNITVAIIVATLLGFCVYTWVREWRFEGRLIYRLMLLPGSRMSVVWAKLAAIFLMIMAILTVQVLLIILAAWLFNLILAPYHIALYPWYYFFSNAQASTPLLFPASPVSFFLTYFMGSSVILALFFGSLYYLNRRQLWQLVPASLPVVVVVSAYLYLILSLRINSHLLGRELMALCFLATLFFLLVLTLLIRREVYQRLSL